MFCGFQQDKLLNYCKERDIAMTAYSPLVNGRSEILKDPRLIDLDCSINILSNYFSPGVVTGAMCPYPIVVRMVVVKKTDWIKSQLSV